MQLEQIKTLLQAELPGCEIQLASEGNHLAVTAIGDIFEGLNAVKKQQLIYAGLKDAIADGSVHAVNIKTFTPAEWAQANA